MRYAHDPSAPRKAANLSVNSDLLLQAKQLGINLSSLFESTLAVEVQKLKSQAWLEENQKTIQAYNQSVDAHGTFGDNLRGF